MAGFNHAFIECDALMTLCACSGATVHVNPIPCSVIEESCSVIDMFNTMGAQLMGMEPSETSPCPICNEELGLTNPDCPCYDDV